MNKTFDSTDRFKITGQPFIYKAGHNRDRWMLFLAIITRIEVPLYYNQLIEIWHKHRNDLDANRPPDSSHHRAILERSSVEKEVRYALNRLLNKGVIRKL